MGYTYRDIASNAIIFGATVRSNDDVHALNDTLESLKKILLFQLKFQKRTVHFVHEHNRNNSFADGLT